MIPIVTIDGPSGSGKGTLAKRLSSELKWNYLDSGLLYRCYAFFYSREQVNIREQINKITFSNLEGKEKILWQGNDITNDLRGKGITLLSSELSQNKEIREKLFLIQKSYHKKPGLIAEGRDMSSIVFPESKIKIFLTAAIEERVQRRANQLRNAGQKVNISELKNEIELRDERDTKRSHSPLKQTQDSTLIDSSSRTVREITNLIIKLVNEKY